MVYSTKRTEKIDKIISQVISGSVAGTMSEAYFGVTYNSEFLYIGLDVNDDVLTMLEMGEVIYRWE